MDFFKSVFSDDPQEPEGEPGPSQSPDTQTTPTESPRSPNLPSITNAWTFGSTLLKTITTKSESIIDTYRRDLKEFTTGLKEETTTILHDLPDRLDSGAAIAAHSLESLGQAVDNLANTLTQNHRYPFTNVTNSSKNSSNDDNSHTDDNAGSSVSGFRTYNRVDNVIKGMQCDMKTFCEEVEDVDEYKEWRNGLDLKEKSEEIEGLLNENRVLKEIYDEVVPGVVDEETFWGRYFYRVSKVVKAEEVRARLVKRAMVAEEDEELSWDVDDDDDEGDNGTDSGVRKDEVKLEGVEKKMEDLRIDADSKSSGSESKGDGGKGAVVDVGSSCSGDKAGVEERVGSDGRNDTSSDFSVISSQRSSTHEEEDLGWDEIEDIASDDESRAAGVAAREGVARVADLSKRLSAAEEDEDLTWDVEDEDDEPVKS